MCSNVQLFTFSPSLLPVFRHHAILLQRERACLLTHVCSQEEEGQHIPHILPGEQASKQAHLPLPACSWSGVLTIRRIWLWLKSMGCTVQCMCLTVACPCFSRVIAALFVCMDAAVWSSHNEQHPVPGHLCRTGLFQRPGLALLCRCGVINCTDTLCIRIAL